MANFCLFGMQSRHGNLTDLASELWLEDITLFCSRGSEKYWLQFSKCFFPILIFLHYIVMTRLHFVVDLCTSMELISFLQL